MDSACTHTMSNNKKYIKGDLIPTNLGISVANHDTVKDVNKGSLNLKGEILYSPHLAHMLISVRQLVLQGYVCVFNNTDSHLVTPKGRKVPLLWDCEFWSLVPAELTPAALRKPDPDVKSVPVEGLNVPRMSALSL
eukprot:1025827-Rhodomonas_salina.3